MYNMFQPHLLHNCHFSISVYTASGRYIGEISKTAPIAHIKHTGHLAVHFWPVII